MNITPHFVFTLNGRNTRTIYPVNGGALMVSTKQKEVLGIFDFVRQQQAYGLQRLLAPIHIVAQKQIVGARRKAAILEQTQQVRVLAVDVTADNQGRFEFQQDRLLEENLTRFDAETADFRLGHLHGFAGTTSANCVRVCVEMCVSELNMGSKI